jgi:hypothetical protein
VSYPFVSNKHGGMGQRNVNVSVFYVMKMLPVESRVMSSNPESQILAQVFRHPMLLRENLSSPIVL